MKFAHIADCHIDSWRDPKLRDISAKAFIKAVDESIEANVDFVIIAGDLFNTSLPSIDRLKIVVKKLKNLKDKDIPVYIVPGSHDFSPSGKTMIDVLEDAGLLINVAKGEIIDDKINLKFTVDKKTGVKLTGMLGKKGSLEKSYYENLNTDILENESGYKIFIFHSAITELKPKSLEKIDSHPLSLLPKNFNYYAGGHPHFVYNKFEDGYGMIAYPGPLFPNNFKELEELGKGGFYIIEDEKIDWHPIQIFKVFSIKVNCSNITPEKVKEDIVSKIKDNDFNDTIVTIRVEGILESGKSSDINFNEIFQLLFEKGAYFVMKNTSAVESKEFKEIKLSSSTINDVEDTLIKEHLGQIKVENLSLEKEESLIKNLMNVLNAEKLEGERVADFEKRIKMDISNLTEDYNI